MPNRPRSPTQVRHPTQRPPPIQAMRISFPQFHRLAPWLLAALLTVGLVGLPAALPATGQVRRVDKVAPAHLLTPTGQVWLPLLWRGTVPFSPSYRNPTLAAKAWSALDAYRSRYPSWTFFPRAEDDLPSAALARADI